MYKIILILFGFTLGLLSSQAQATTYYLDSTSGNDFRGGVQAAAAWKTLRYASSKMYYPGDQILLKAGSVWDEPLEITTSDAEGDPIIIGSYGIGDQPNAHFVGRIIVPDHAKKRSQRGCQQS